MEIPIIYITVGIALHIVELAGLIVLMIKEVFNDEYRR